MRHKFLVLIVKKRLKSVYIYGSYRKIKTGVSLFLDHSVEQQQTHHFNGHFLGKPGLQVASHLPFPSPYSQYCSSHSYTECPHDKSQAENLFDVGRCGLQTGYFRLYLTLTLSASHPKGFEAKVFTDQMPFCCPTESKQKNNKERTSDGNKTKMLRARPRPKV